MPYDFKGVKRGEHMGTLPDGTQLYKYHYVTPDAHATVIAANYFNDLAVRGMLKRGDCIEVISSTGGTPVWRMLVVTATTATTVTVAAVTGAGQT
jgi:hypothetical protein